MAEQIGKLEVGVSANVQAFQDALRGLGNEAETFSRAITRTFRDAVTDGKSFEEVLKGLALRLADIALNSALQPIQAGLPRLLTNLFEGLTGIQTLASASKVQPFASGGVLAAPTFFPTSGGVGLAGEAGPEAILPLSRGSDGRL